MREEKQVPFLEMFPFCTGLSDMCGGLDGAFVKDADVNREKLSMKIIAVFRRCAIPAELHTLEGRIAAEFGLNSVVVGQENAAAPVKKTAGPAEKRALSPARPGRTVFGRAARGAPVPMRTLTLESGSVVVCGEVFSVKSREIAKTKAWVLRFEMTDYTGSVRVSKYFKPGEARGGLGDIKEGMYLTVSGNILYDRYDEDIALEPRGVMLAEKPKREDRAETKRVELHLHTKYSALDALTDTGEAVKRAAEWGHPAVAITDHGVVQAFPEAWHAGKKHGIKIIYGVEGYYVNDIDDRLIANSGRAAAFTDEFCAFDIETTGLDAAAERMTEIGAVIIRDGEVVSRFRTFVDPEKPIPREITELTGITDRDVFGAPGEGEALKSFVSFAGALPLVAHNAEFDIGFMKAAAKRRGLCFEPVCVDTLTLAQTLLPDLRRHKLDMVAGRLGLPDFNHHRADDDALTCGRIMTKFAGMLAERGITRLDQLQGLAHGEYGGNPRQLKVRHIILLVKNKKGLKNLYELISKSHLAHFRKNPIIPKSLLLEHREGLIVGSACEAGEIFDAVVRHRSDEALERLAGLYDYLEIQPVCNNLFMLENGTAKNAETLRDFNRRVIVLADRLGKPAVATCDVHFLDPEQEIFRRILLAGRSFSDADRSLPLYFRTTDEMLEEFAYLGEEKCREVVIDNPRAVAELCEEIALFPETLFTPKLENSAEDLERLVYGRMHALYGETPPEIVKNRVETELGDIIGCHYDVIYMSAQRLVANSLAAGYLVGSRGSVGSSIAAFLSGITEVNSLSAHYRCPSCKYSDFESGKGYGCGADMPDKSCPVCGTELRKDGFDIPFETFLGFGGDKVPDIDLNFSGEYQARAHKYTEELFGRDHVFKAGTVGTLAEKTAFGYVKNYLSERGLKVTKAEENRLAQGCVGVKRTTGQHPGGLVIIPQDMDVTDFCPVQHPADDPESDIITTHFEYHSMEANLLKLDELGHDDPTMIKMLEDLTGEDARQIPFDDPDTRGIFCSPAPLGLPEDDPIIGRTGTIGIPEFGTGFTRQMLVDTKPKDFDTLVRLSGFSHGTDVWAGNIRELVLSGTATVKETVGCRDDIMLYLMSKGMSPKRAFRFMEAVRKGAIHKGGTWPEGIVEEMRSLGVPEWYIESCRRIQYLFPKAHAVAYVMMAFRIAWFKVHFPLAYYSCHFYRRSDSFDAELMTSGIEPVRRAVNRIKNDQNAGKKDEDTLTTLEAVYEFYLRGFGFGRMDLYKSEATRFVLDGNALIPPFIAIAGLGEAAANDLVKCREGGRRFISVEEVMGACPKVSQTHMQQLKALGALGDMPDTSQMSLF
ncbi:MAG: PolC-type DNA polymerase III [Oscillospiraceae bacterium]|jgi:DNA polymerase-3 subunit alpha (Gram-positive type)|nr:PolC-type DNA polymerase III [Oscillospiraceae bacterium]